jgi:hypothetical protein
MSRFSLRLLPSTLVLSVAVLCVSSLHAQNATPAQDTAVPQPAHAPTYVMVPATKKKKVRPAKGDKKDDKIVASKDTKQAEKRAKRDNPLAGVDVKLPD